MTRRWVARHARVIPASPGVSTQARFACAAFGLLAETRDEQGEAPPALSGRRGSDAACVPGLLGTIRRVPITLITGASGSGKSTLLRSIQSGLGDAIRCAPITDPDAAVFDQVHRVAGSTRAAMRALSACGLAEPALWVRPAGVLSEGESARLELAIAMSGAPAGGVVLCDEFASNLDRANAAALACSAAQWARRARVRLVAATAHEDMPSLLAPDLLLDPRGQQLGPPIPRRPVIRYEVGTHDDYRALARFHYLGDRPATVVGILRAVRQTHTGERLAGVLTISMPTLNGAWRRQAWPDFDAIRSKQSSARWLNREVRCISRVIIEPASRGIGVASGLVRAYLADPFTVRTEAVAAMGGLSPFFAAAGMTEYRLPRAAHDARLADALHHAGIVPAMLMDHRVSSDPFLAREIRRWGTHARIAPDTTDPLPAIARHAVCRLASSPRAYAHQQGGHDDGPQHTTRAR